MKYSLSDQISEVAKTRLPSLVVDALIISRRYRLIHGRYPNFLFPKTFNEKILSRNLLGRNILIPLITDKFLVRSYVESKLSSELLPDLYWVTTDPSDIPFGNLPKSFVIKPTHGSGWVRIVKDKDSLDTATAIQECEKWLGQNYYKLNRERIYRKITPRIIVEELITTPSFSVPEDYKFYVFAGRVHMIEVLAGRFDALESVLFDRSWNRMDVSYEGDTPIAIDPPRPKFLDEMIQIAEKLAEDLSFIRVDLYQTEQKVYFGELTASSGAGLDRFKPDTYDAHLGSLWPRPL